MKKKNILVTMLLVLGTFLSSCSYDGQDDFSENQIASIESMHIYDESAEHNSLDDNSEKEEVISAPVGQVINKEENFSILKGQAAENGSETNVEEIRDTSYSIRTYTEAPNKNSSINIQYPFFEEEGKETLNHFIIEKVQEFTQINNSLFPEDSCLTVNYQTEVTLHNEKMVSIVFWGTSSISEGAYETTDMIPVNIDIRTMEEILFEDLYDANKEFEKVFFEKAYFPTNPVTSYDDTEFAGMLQLQSPEYQSISPFSIPGNVRCFLKPDALVLSMPSVHATGSDHFEAQINYDVIEEFYLLEQKYWDCTGCAAYDDTDHSDAMSDGGEISEAQNGYREEALPAIRSEASALEKAAASLDEKQQNMNSRDSVEKGMMLYGSCELGCGWWLYTVPDQEGQDYKMYFFVDKSKDYKERYQSFEEMDFDLEQADYVFPDVRENNVAIGKFTGIYLCEPLVMESGESAWIVVAAYETGDRQYYDTRIYKWSGEGYVINEAMTEELNTMYSDVEEYPVLQIIEMPHD